MSELRGEGLAVVPQITEVHHELYFTGTNTSIVAD